MKRQWECPHAELMWVKVDPWVIFPKNGHGHPPINRGQESPMMVTLPYHTIPNYNYIPCCDHGTCGDGEPITSFIQFSWSPPFQGSWTTIRRNLNWHKIEDWNRKIVAIISNHAWGIIQSLTSECNKFGLGLAIDRCIDFLGAETYVLSIRPKVVSQRQNLAFDVCPGSRLKSNWTLDRFFKIHVIFIWLVVLIVLFYHPSKNGMMLPNASINFGSESQPPTWFMPTEVAQPPTSPCHFPFQFSQGQSWWSQWPWRLPAAPGLQAGTICKKLFCQKNHPITQVWPTSTQSDPSRADYATLDPEFLAWSHAAHQADAIPGQWHAEWGWLWG